uniref:Uncharacterized protein n=1 Tax=Davidia involucrata TaxID=16924 RepID=A0A5B7BVY9_DAVIN
MMKEMQKMFQAMNFRFDQLVVSRDHEMDESSVYLKIAKLNFPCYNGNELNFSYYKENKESLLKVELKKILITRAISPELGRHKSSNVALNNLKRWWVMSWSTYEMRPEQVTQGYPNQLW